MKVPWIFIVSFLVVHKLLGETIVDGLGVIIAFVVAVAWFRFHGQTHQRIVVFELHNLDANIFFVSVNDPK